MSLEELRLALSIAAQKEPRWSPLLKPEFYLGDWRIEEDSVDEKFESTLKFRFGGIGKRVGRYFTSRETFCADLADFILDVIHFDLRCFEDILGKVTEIKKG